MSELKKDGSEKEYEETLYDICSFNLEIFSIAYFPHYCTLEPSQFHEDYYDHPRIGEKKLRSATAAPRGYAKTTHRALIRPIHDLCYGNEKFIIILSATDPLAIGKIKDIRDELLTNSDLRKAYKISFDSAKPGATGFVAYAGDHKIRYEGHGRGVEVRGLRWNQFRPSKIVLDDIEDSEEVNNEALRKKDEQWFQDVIGKLGDQGTSIEIIGTILHKQSLLAKTLKNPVYDGRIYRAIEKWSEREDLWVRWKEIYTNLDNPKRVEESEAFYRQNEAEMLRGTKVLWPARESYLDLQKEIIEFGMRSFRKEKQNDPVLDEDAVFTQFHWYTEEREGLRIEKSNILVPWSELEGQARGALDPATGEVKPKAGKLGDYAAILTGYKDSKDRLFLHHAWMERKPPTVFIEQIFELHLRFKYHSFAVETNLFRNLLMQNIVTERKRLEQKDGKIIRIPFYEVENVENKRKRIYQLEPKVTHGWILFNRALSQVLLDQLEQFPHADHDDGPDALEMLWKLVQGVYKPAPMSINPMARLA